MRTNQTVGLGLLTWCCGFGGLLEDGPMSTAPSLVCSLDGLFVGTCLLVGRVAAVPGGGVIIWLGTRNVVEDS
jgi:hypothetical protein